MKRQHMAAIVAAIVVWFVFFRKARAAQGGPVVAGDVTSGSRSATIDTNVLSDTFGEVIPGDIVAGGATP